MKKIFIPMEIHGCQYQTVFPIHGAPSSYIQKLVSYDLLPIFVSSLHSPEQIEYLYKSCDGALYMGGADIDPILYRCERHPSTSVDEKERDLLEIPYLRKILADRVPFFGICRGAQALAVASKGALLQHVPDLFPDERHAPVQDAPYDALLDGPFHEVILDTSSVAYRVLKREKILVNSYHHQMVEEPGDDLRIVGRSPSGVVEIIEHKDPEYFCIGVQSHPEVADPSFFEPFFAAFAEAVHAKDL